MTEHVKMIFESPDNGKTIYVRKSGSSIRFLLNEANIAESRGLTLIK